MTDSIDPQLQTMIDNMPENTGRSLEEWFHVIDDAALEKHGDIMKLLKGEHSVTHGYSNTISILYRQRAAGGTPEGEQLVNAQYTGPKAGLIDIYQAVLSAVEQFGADVEIAPKKSYVSLRRSKQFAIVQPSTKTRVDLGLNLKGIEPTDRLVGGKIFGGMCSHLVRLTSASEVDDEVATWLKQAYDLA